MVFTFFRRTIGSVLARLRAERERSSSLLPFRAMPQHC